MDHLCFFVSCVSHAFQSVHCCLMVTSWERADLLALVGDVYCIFVTSPCGILGYVWYLIVSFPYLCPLSYFNLVQSQQNQDHMYSNILPIFPFESSTFQSKISINTLIGEYYLKFQVSQKYLHQFPATHLHV